MKVPFVLELALDEISYTQNIFEPLFSRLMVLLKAKIVHAQRQEASGVEHGGGKDVLEEREDQ